MVPAPDTRTDGNTGSRVGFMVGVRAEVKAVVKGGSEKKRPMFPVPHSQFQVPFR